MRDINTITSTNQFGGIYLLTFDEGLQHIESFMHSEFGLGFSLGFSLGLDYSSKKNCFEIEVRKVKESFRVYLFADLTLAPTRSLDSEESRIYKSFKNLWYRAYGLSLGFFQ